MADSIVPRMQNGRIGLMGNAVAAIVVGPHWIECHGKDEASGRKAAALAHEQTTRRGPQLVDPAHNGVMLISPDG